VTTSLGEAVVSDFDGTLAKLEIAWQSLRETLGIERIDDLWQDADLRRWDAVTSAEIEAAAGAEPVTSVIEALGSVSAIAVLTSNDEAAVETFLERWPELRARVRTIVGRRTLGGPKTDFEVFSSGYATCLDAIGAESPMITYVGDMRYELDYARRLGARAFDVKELEAS
jgi:phosphoglycolate phosphatase-like HAD superfamily hydrolase